MTTAEHQRLAEAHRGEGNWRLWGPYLAERAWGTVREDYSADGDAWESFTHDEARSRAYRWNEDGLAGISDHNQYLCLGFSVWNGKDPILKERLFGLTNTEGNHGEDVKEYYWYRDATPTHSYLEARYRYPQDEFPYEDLVATNARRTRYEPEYELIDTGILDEDRFFDIDVVYAKDAPDDIVMAITATNRGPDAAELHILPTLWFRNTWSWGYPEGPRSDVPTRPLLTAGPHPVAVTASHPALGTYHWYAESADDIWFTDNETNPAVLGFEHKGHFKDAFHRRVIQGDEDATNSTGVGTKAAAAYRTIIEPGGTYTVRTRLTREPLSDPFESAGAIIAKRMTESDEFHHALGEVDPRHADVRRQAIAGLIWTKQYFYYNVAQWLDGDPAGPKGSPQRQHGRNSRWRHLDNADVISMPDAWEYPWYAAWDLAFQVIPLALVDPRFAKHNLRLMTHEWYMHPNGQLPAYEWEFSNVNPPVFAWATRRLYEIDQQVEGTPDLAFLESMFHKLLLNFTWWVNQVDLDGNNVFQGGFLGLDNVSILDRSMVLPSGGHVDQSDGTAWMAFYTLGMLRIALELAHHRPSYQDIATKFFEHFLAIDHALTLPEFSLWNPDDGFFYDVLHLSDGTTERLEVRSLVGLLPLIGVEVIEREVLEATPQFVQRARWMKRHHPDLTINITGLAGDGPVLLSLLDTNQLRSVLSYMLDPDEFLSPHGIRSLSAFHRDHPFRLELDGVMFSIGYEPGESTTGLFGGNSNWRGPVWLPINFLIIEALRDYQSYFGDAFLIEHPTGSGIEMNLGAVADDLCRRLISLFVPDETGHRPSEDPQLSGANWSDGIHFYEYFDGDTGRGLGASHQTGWTALVAKLIDELK